DIMAIKTKSERAPAGTLTVDDLTRAIKNSIDRTGMKEEEARAMAQHVLNFFGYSERIIDNVLEPEDRDAFYMLEDSGILTTERRVRSMARECGRAIRPSRNRNAWPKFSRVRRAFAPISSVRMASSESPRTVKVRGRRRTSASSRLRTDAKRART